MKVLQTTNYSLFKTLEGNRKTNELHKSRLDKSIKKELLISPIIVNEKYEIIDGQHRFEICKSQNKPINYIMCEGYGLEQVHLYNANNKTWSADDYMNSYAGLGKMDYHVYKLFKEKYNFNHSVTRCILTQQHGEGGGDSRGFATGKLSIKNDMDWCVDVANKIVSLKKYYKGYLRRSFVMAIIGLLKKPQFDFSEFVHKLELQPTSLVKCADSKQYIELIEEIYNYRRQNKINLRF